jgi:hypothetical protein
MNDLFNFIEKNIEIVFLRGYLNNEKLTNEKFILNPFENNNSKLYKQEI